MGMPGSSRNCEDFTNKCPTGYVEVPSQRLVGFSGNDILRGTGDVLCEIRSQNEQLAAPASPADPRLLRLVLLNDRSSWWAQLAISKILNVESPLALIKSAQVPVLHS